MKAFPRGTTAKDINAKVGDKFVLVEPDTDEDYQKGDVATLYRDDSSTCPTFKLENGSIIYIYWQELAPLIRELDHLQVGDVLVHENGNERMVLGICGKVVFLSSLNDFNYYSDGYTVSEIREDGYTLKDATPAPAELTVAEVAQKLGYKPGELRIKE